MDSRELDEPSPGRWSCSHSSALSAQPSENQKRGFLVPALDGGAESRDCATLDGPDHAVPVWPRQRAEEPDENGRGSLHAAGPPPHRAKMLIIIQNLSGRNAAVSCCAHHRHTEDRTAHRAAQILDRMDKIRAPFLDTTSKRCGAEFRHIRSRPGKVRPEQSRGPQNLGRPEGGRRKSFERGLGVEALDRQSQIT
jgi:hypothetical protein